MRSLPLPVRRNRFLAPLLDFSFGISIYPMAWLPESLVEDETRATTGRSGQTPPVSFVAARVIPAQALECKGAAVVSRFEILPNQRPDRPHFGGLCLRYVQRRALAERIGTSPSYP